MSVNSGIDIIPTKNLPTKVYNKEINEWVAIHMTQIDNTIYVSNEIFKALKQNSRNEDLMGDEIE